MSPELRHRVRMLLEGYAGVLDALQPRDPLLRESQRELAAVLAELRRPEAKPGEFELLRTIADYYRPMDHNTCDLCNRDHGREPHHPSCEWGQWYQLGTDAQTQPTPRHGTIGEGEGLSSHGVTEREPAGLGYVAPHPYRCPLCDHHVEDHGPNGCQQMVSTHMRCLCSGVSTSESHRIG